MTGDLPNPNRGHHGNRILVFYGSYRSDRMGIRLAQFVVERLRRRGDEAELIDAKAINLPMLDRMYKEYPKGEAPEALEAARPQDPRCRRVRVRHRRIQLGRPARTEKPHRSFPRGVVLAPRRDRRAIRPDVCPACARQPPGTAYSPRWGWWSSPARSPLVRSGRPCRPKANLLARAARRLNSAFPRFADDLMWWVEAAKAQRQRKAPPY